MKIQRAHGLAVLLAGCAPSSHSRPAPPPPVVASSPLGAPSSETGPHARPASPVPGRRGACDLDKALEAYLLGQPAVRCGALGRRARRAEIEDLRACVLAAYRERRPFLASWVTGTIDSTMRTAVVGRELGDGLEVRWYAYDSCPHGCGDADPVWSSVGCGKLEDVRAACKALGKPERWPKKIDDDLRWACDDEEGRGRRESFDLRCVNRSEGAQCGWDELRGRERTP